MTRTIVAVTAFVVGIGVGFKLGYGAAVAYLRRTLAQGPVA